MAKTDRSSIGWVSVDSRSGHWYPNVPFRRCRFLGGIVVTLRHIRLWMAAVPQWSGFEGGERSWRYVRKFRVPSKIALFLEAGTFYPTVLKGLTSRGTLDPKTLRFIRQASAALARVPS